MRCETQTLLVGSKEPVRRRMQALRTEYPEFSRNQPNTHPCVWSWRWGGHGSGGGLKRLRRFHFHHVVLETHLFKWWLTRPLSAGQESLKTLIVKRTQLGVLISVAAAGFCCILHAPGSFFEPYVGISPDIRESSYEAPVYQAATRGRFISLQGQLLPTCSMMVLGVEIRIVSAESVIHIISRISVLWNWKGFCCFGFKKLYIAIVDLSIRKIIKGGSSNLLSICYNNLPSFSFNESSPTFVVHTQKLIYICIKFISKYNRRIILIGVNHKGLINSNWCTSESESFVQIHYWPPPWRGHFGEVCGRAGQGSAPELRAAGLDQPICVLEEWNKSRGN